MKLGLGSKASRLLLLFLIAAAILGQGESEPYFALSTSRTFNSGSAPTVSVSAWNVDALEFRVYRVKDPQKFFQELDDPHQFGRLTPQPPHERSWLEQFVYWKRDLRTDIRRSLRGQFTESPSAHLLSQKAAAPLPANGLLKETHFPETPVLNQDQLAVSFVQRVSGSSRWAREDVGVPVRDPGVYLVEAVNKQLRAYTILMISDLTMITKSANGRIVNMVVDRATGQPVPNVTVSALAKSGEKEHAVTDRDGIAELSATAAQQDDLIIFAHNDRHVAVNSIRARYDGAAGEWSGYIYTDRPVYRPAHTVHFKGIFRLRAPDGYHVPAGQKISITIEDSDQKQVYQKTLIAGANGTVHDDLVLAPGAALGGYFIQAKGGGDEGFMNGNFNVEDYKKPEYEVHVTPTKSRVLQGAMVQAVIDSRYFFGEPVSGGKVKYSVYRSRYWFPLWHDSDDDSISPQPEPDSDNDAGDQVSEQTAQLDADGKFTINVPTSLSEHKEDYLYQIEAGVTDVANREISGTGWVVATYGSFALNVTPDRYVYAPGGQATLTVEARDYDNQPVHTRARVELLQWNSRRNTTKSIATKDVDIASGPAKVDFAIPQQGGSFMVRVTARTPEGRDVEDSTYLWVSGGNWDFDSSRGEGVQILADKKTYSAGDTAKLMIVAGQANTPVYVTVEGRDIEERKLIRSQDSTVPFEIPVTEKNEPGIAVSATFVRNGTLYSGSKYVRVPPVNHQLNVKIATDKQQYLPGQSADYNIEVTGADGNPTPRAEFSLGVVDEAIYGVRRDTTPDILSFFFDRDYNRVNTDSSLEYYFTGEAGRRRMQLATLRPRSRLAQLKPERLVQPKIRKAFPDTSFWATDVVTDASGHAHAKVEFPDSLTTWRATARGITPDTKVGAATLKTIVRKNLIVRLAVPRFFVRGDEVVVSALVHNYLQDAKQAHVSLDVKGLDVLDGAAKDIQVPSRGEVKVDWRVRAQQVVNATITAKALTNEESDGLEMTLPVNFAGIKLAQSKGGSMPAGGAAGTTEAFDIAYPNKVEPGSRSLSIRLSPSIAGSLFGALDYLTTFPYGCVEQTMSSFLPNIVVKDAVRTLGVKNDLDDAALQEKIRAGLDRLYSFQHEDGGWGWWETDESHPFMTAYVVAGLIQARTAGTQVRQETIDKGVAWLKKDFAADPKLAIDLRAYIVYALSVAGQSDAASAAEIYKRKADLSPYGLALFGLALEQMKDARAGEIAAALESNVQQDQQQAWWSATRDPMLDLPEDVTPEATAYVAKFLSHQRKESPLLPKAAVWLMNHRDEGYWWSSTKQTAMVIYGLSDYLRTTHELMPNLTATVFVNEKAVLTRRISDLAATGSPDLVLDESKLQPGMNHVRVVTSGEGRLYYSTRGEYYSSDAHLEKSGTTSLNLLRDYFRLTPSKNGDRIVYDTVPLDGPVAAGDVIAVRLTVTGSEWKYVMLEDPIPAGTEFIERDNLYELRNRPPWWAYTFTRRELHDDRMAIFQTYFPQGQQQYFYLLKVVNPGAFQVSPARVGPMYQSDVLATSEGRRLEVK